MRKLSLSLMAAAAAFTTGSAAVAQSAPQTAPAQHERQPMTRAAAEQRADKAFDRLDANHDGKIDQADRAARQKARFDRIDANHDGQLSYAEFTAMNEQRGHGDRHPGDQRGDRAGRDGRDGGHRMAHGGFGRGGVRGGHGGMGMVSMADANKDGAITKAEFQAAAVQRFERLDANHDGTVTPDEAKAARDNMRQQWQARRDARQG